VPVVGVEQLHLCYAVVRSGASKVPTSNKIAVDQGQSSILLCCLLFWFFDIGFASWAIPWTIDLYRADPIQFDFVAELVSDICLGIDQQSWSLVVCGIV